MRSPRLDTKFHHRWRGPSSAAPPKIMQRAPAALATITSAPISKTSITPASWRAPASLDRPLDHVQAALVGIGGQREVPCRE